MSYRKLPNPASERDAPQAERLHAHLNATLLDVGKSTVLSGYVIALLAGIVVGCIVSRGWRSAAQLTVAGVCFIALAAATAMVTAYEGPDIAALLVLSISPLKDNWGLMQLTVIGYTCVIGSLVAALRTALEKSDARANNSADI